MTRTNTDKAPRSRLGDGDCVQRRSQEPVGQTRRPRPRRRARPATSSTATAITRHRSNIKRSPPRRDAEPRPASLSGVEARGCTAPRGYSLARSGGAARVRRRQRFEPDVCDFGGDDVTSTEPIRSMRSPARSLGRPTCLGRNRTITNWWLFDARERGSARRRCRRGSRDRHRRG